MMKNRFRIETYRIRGLSYEIGLILTLLPILLITIGGITSVNASSNEVSCFERGIVDGEDHPINQELTTIAEMTIIKDFLKDVCL